MVVQQGFGGADVGLDASLTFEQEGALTPGKIAHFDELNTWTQSGTSRMIRKDDWKRSAIDTWLSIGAGWFLMWYPAHTIGIRVRLSESPAPLRINPYSPQ